MPIHLRTSPSEVAPFCFLVGDPGRARRIAERLDRATCYNENRGLLGFTGRHEGRRLSVQTTGMGGPSAAIVVEELARLGVRTVIRLGTCGAVGRAVGVLDIVVAAGAVPIDGTVNGYVDGEPYAPIPDVDVTHALVTAARDGARPAHAGLVASHDVFYREDAGWPRWRDRGVLAVEMEAAAVFTVALLRGLRAGAALLAVDAVGAPESWASDEAIAQGVEDLIDVGFDAARRLGS